MITQERRTASVGKRPMLWMLATGLLLLVPAIAMRFTDEVRWTASDFLVAAVLLGGLGGGVELALRLPNSVAVKIAAIVAVTSVFALIWINGAVGIVGSEANPAGWFVVAVASAILAAAVRLLARMSR